MRKWYLHVLSPKILNKFWLNFILLRQSSLYLYVTNSLVQSPSWDADSSSAGHGNPTFLRESNKVHYYGHKSTLLNPLDNKLDPVHTFTHYFFRTYLNIILLYIPRLSKWSLPIIIYNSVCISHHKQTCHILLNFILITISDKKYKLSNSLLHSFLHPPVTCSLLVPNILLHILFSDAFNSYSSLRMKFWIFKPLGF
jgi:hypothetical protein